MRKFKSRILAALLILAAALSGSGCDYRDVDKLEYVMGAGIDLSAETGRYTMTVEIAKLSEGSQDAVEATVLSGEGETLTEMLENVGRKTAGELYFLQSVILVFGESAAKSGIGDLLDALMRSDKSHGVVNVAVVKGADAADVFAAKPVALSLVSTELGQAIAMQAREYGSSCNQRAFELYDDLPTGLASFLPAIRAEKAKDEVTLTLDGIAVVVRGRLCGFLPPEEAKLALLLDGEFKYGFLALENPQTGEKFDYRITRHEAACTPVMRCGKLAMQISLDLEGSIPQSEGSGTGKARPDAEALLAFAREQIKADVERLVRKLKSDWGADPFYFGPKAQNALRAKAGDWEKTYRDLPFETVVNVKITEAGAAK